MKTDLLKDLNASLRLGQESFETKPETIEDTLPTPEGDTATSIDIESVEAGDDLTDLTAEADSELETSESVEELSAAVEHATTTGHKLSRIEAAALTLAFQQVTKKHYSNPVALLPARESNQGTNLTDLTLVHESMKSTASDLYKKAVETIKAILKRVKEFIHGLIDKYGALSSRFGKIYVAAKEIKVEPEGQVGVNSALFELNGKVNKEIVLSTISTVKRADADSYFHTDIFNSTDKTVTEGGDSYRELIQKVSKKVRDDLESIGTIKVNNGSAPEGIVDYVELPGNTFFGSIKLSDTGLLALKIGKLEAGKNQAEDVVEKGQKVGARESLVEVASKSEIIKQIAEIDRVIKGIKVNATKAVRDSHVESVLKNVKDSVGGSEQLDGSDKVNVKLFVKYVTAQSNYLRDLSTWGFDRLVGIADFFEKSLKSTTLDAESKEVETPVGEEAKTA